MHVNLPNPIAKKKNEVEYTNNVKLEMQTDKYILQKLS